MIKIKKHIFIAFLRDVFLIVLALFLAMFFKELAHFIIANYYNLEPVFKIAEGSIGTTAKFSSDEFASRLINIGGLCINIILSIVSILVLFILQVYIPGKEETIVLYDKKLHSLIEEKYRFLIGGHINFKLFLLIFILANLLLTLFVLLLYPYQGVL